jgi:hypothetical protein
MEGDMTVVEATMASKKKTSAPKRKANKATSRKPKKASRAHSPRVAAKKARARKAAPVEKAPARKVAAKKPAPPKKTRAHTTAHAVFGHVTVHPAEGLSWQKALKLADRDVDVDMTIEDAADVTPELLDRAARFVARLAPVDALARSGLRHSFEEDADSPVALYVTHHLAELNAETLYGIFAKARDAISVEDFLTHLYPRWVNLYPARAGGTATFDYTISADATQYVLAVGIDEEGEVLGVEMES